MIYREVDVYGILLPGLLVVTLAALCVAFVLHRVFAAFGLNPRVWHQELFHIAAFVIVLGALAQALS